MAEINVPEKGNGIGVRKSKKLSTRVDLTPMVDLGFLLITFFIFTTTMSQATAMKLNLPKDVKDPDQEMKIKENAVITVLPMDSKLFYYEGKLKHDRSNIVSSNYKDIRKVLIDKKQRTDPAFFFVIIKPAARSTYGNTVDLLDEMFINDINKYALDEITVEEENMLHSFTTKTN
jgi:biopolymer transport protein ExbD